MHTAVGDIRGFNDSVYAVRRFLRIPFAQPPVGSLRFQPPLPLPTLTPSPFPATNRTYIPCVETATSGPFRMAGSEDCLFLSVTLPSASGPRPPPSAGYPVLVYIYGGSLTQAYPEGADSFISTSQAFIFVSINYRLGVFGFFSLPQLSAEKPGPVAYSGNQGLQDQQLALQWVQDNIGAFGG